MTFCSVDIYVITGAFFVYFLLAEKVIGRKFEITEYGICFIEDILDDIPDSVIKVWTCLLYTSPSPRDRQKSRMPSSA